MGRLRLLCAILWNEKWMRLYMVALTLLLVVCADISISLLKEEYELEQIGEVCDFSDTAYFSWGGTVSPLTQVEERRECNALLDELEQNGAGVGEIACVNTYWDEARQNVMLFLYDEQIISHVKLPLSEGSWLDADGTNEVVLAYPYRWRYRVGDEIPFAFGGSDGKTHNARLRVAGFLAKECYVMYFNSSGYVDVGDLIRPVQDAVITNGICDDTGRSCTFSGSAGCMLYGVPEDSEPARQLSRFGALTGMDEVARRYVKNADGRLREQLLLEAVLVLLAVTGLGSANFVSMYTRRREYGIYFLCGATGKQVIAMTSLANGLVVGAVLAAVDVIFLLRPSLLPGFGLPHVLVTFGLFAVLLFATSLPFYLMMQRESIADLTRR